jgi:hypothetical protein
MTLSGPQPIDEDMTLAPRSLFRSDSAVFHGDCRKCQTATDRGREGSRLPSLRTVRAVVPHTALQSGDSSSRRSRRQPGRVKREQPGFREEGIWPTLMIGATDSHARRPPLLSAEKGA